ncbi:hypothetical protein Tco_0977646 [Tanacetum coccineum]|uniref:Uncharacterized protein n=1 Tax=Tanacetum coccineum TaxID=301880 RepID=A0ABQ5EKT1_9ASTR
MSTAGVIIKLVSTFGEDGSSLKQVKESVFCSKKRKSLVPRMELKLEKEVETIGSESSRTVEAGLYSSCYELPSITFSFDLNYANLPLIHLEFEELELDRRELDKQELRLLERHILEYYLYKHCRSAESLVGMSTTASTQISSNPLLDRSRSGRLIFLSWSKAFHIFFKLRISEEIPGVEVLALTLATTGLLRELRTLDLLSMILRQSRGILSKKLPPAAEFNES